jgi:hypothetical protein
MRPAGVYASEDIGNVPGGAWCAVRAGFESVGAKNDQDRIRLI